jgi:hypothetical protein
LKVEKKPSPVLEARMSLMRLEEDLRGSSLLKLEEDLKGTRLAEQVGV